MLSTHVQIFLFVFPFPDTTLFKELSNTFFPESVLLDLINFGFRNSFKISKSFEKE